jgi:hypothetical protein
MKNSWQDEKDLEYRVGKTAFTAITESIVDTQSAIKVLAVTVTAEIGALVMYYIAKDKVLDFLESEGNFWIYASIGIFLIGFLTAFAALRLAPVRSRRRYLTYTIWPISIAAGLANITLFLVLTTFQTR